MDIYIKLFEVLFPVFFVVGIGYYLGKKNPKIDTTFITNFAANVGTPAMIIYALNPVNISFNIFLSYFWYYALAICGFIISGIISWLLKVNIFSSIIGNFFGSFISYPLMAFGMFFISNENIADGWFNYFVYFAKTTLPIFSGILRRF